MFEILMISEVKAEFVDNFQQIFVNFQSIYSGCLLTRSNLGIFQHSLSLFQYLINVHVCSIRQFFVKHATQMRCSQLQLLVAIFDSTNRIFFLLAK
ncbi:hypothetical protein I4U23_026146 [Adineta vaga]|nr:hypothetical protein I4U23_026146 [Adineta vaga]